MKEIFNNIESIIIAYNHEEFISECIESMVSQSIQPDHILVIVNKSSDKTSQIAKKYMAKHRKLDVIDLEDNIGPANSWNLGSNYSKNRYLAFCSGDDKSLESRLEVQLSLMKSKSKSVIANRVNIIDNQSKLLNEMWSNYELISNQNNDVLNTLLWHQNYINASAVLCDKNSNLLMNPILLQLQDFELWLRVAKLNSIHLSSEVVLSYRMTADSLSQRVRQGSMKELSRTELELTMIYETFLFSLNDKELKSLLETYWLQFDIFKAKPNKITSIIIFCLTHNNFIIRNLGRKIIMTSNPGIDFNLISQLFDLKINELWEFVYPEGTFKNI